MTAIQPTRLRPAGAAPGRVPWPRRAATGYLALQAGAGLLWWVGLVCLPALRVPFELDPGRPAVLAAYLPADLVVLVVGSALGACGLWRQRGWTATVVSATAGGIAYATLRLGGWILADGPGGWGLAPMVVATAVTVLIAADLAGDRRVRGDR